jgi:predicted outer membrane repeat protein
MRGNLGTAAGAAAIGIMMAVGPGGAQTAQAAGATEVIRVPCGVAALASAMTSASSSATLSLASGCVYVLTAGLPEVSQDLTIMGHGATLERSYAPATEAFTILSVDAGSLTVNRLNFRNGRGAISVTVDGDLTVIGGTFNRNTATDGGAIYVNNSSSPDPQVTGATFTGNTATDAGGAIYSDCSNASINVDHSTFTGNKAANEGGAIWENGVSGSMTASTFRGNAAGSGGALWLQGRFQ